MRLRARITKANSSGSTVDCIKSYVSNYRSNIVCPSCKSSKIVNVLTLNDLRRPLKTKCFCGHIFYTILETRNYYRKKVNLYGIYWNLRHAPDIGEMNVGSLSRTGIGFRTNMPHDIEINDFLKIEFVLDNSKKSVVRQKAIVRHVHGRSIGAEFCNPAGTELGFYLMP